MKRICAWHKQNFGFELDMGEVFPFDDPSPTHGMCPECLAKSFPEEKHKMNEDEKWEALIKSIRKAAHILGKTLNEEDMPDYLNWFVGTKMNDNLWAQVYARGK